jgi:hypothetical protein
LPEFLNRALAFTARAVCLRCRAAAGFPGRFLQGAPPDEQVAAGADEVFAGIQTFVKSPKKAGR